MAILQENNGFGTKAILLSRVSTKAQETKEGADPQLDNLKAFARSNNYTELKEIRTTEHGFVEMEAKQGWNEVVDFIKDNPDYRTIFVTELTRLGRTLGVLIKIFEYCKENKIQLFIHKPIFQLFDNAEQLSSAAPITFALLSAIASMEMELKKERFHNAKKTLKSEGYSIEGKCLYGYKRVLDSKKTAKKLRNHYIVDEEKAKNIVQLFEWYAYGINHDVMATSVSKIAEHCIELGLPFNTKRKVTKILHEEAYTGHKITHNKRVNALWEYGRRDVPHYVDAESYECVYPPIISRELFDRVQKLMCERNASNSKKRNNTLADKSSKHTTILSKIIVCHGCGRYLTGEYRVKNGIAKNTYRCAFSHGTSSANRCSDNSAYSMVMMDSVIWSFVKSNLEEISKNRAKIASSLNIEELTKIVENLKQNKEENKGIKMHYIDRVYKSKLRFDFKEADKWREEQEAELTKMLADCDEKIQRKEDELRLAKQMKEDVSGYADITTCEMNKKIMSKYIHFLIKEVKPVYHDRTYSIFQVVAFNNPLEAIDFEKDEENGLPVLKDAKQDGIYFIYINKRSTNNIKVRCFKQNWFRWDDERKVLYDDSGSFTKEDVFDDNSGCRTFVEELPYKKLDFYGEDNTTDN